MKTKIIFWIIAFLVSVLFLSACSQEKINCSKSGGKWTSFSNSCVDFCNTDNTDVCIDIATEGCDCGPDKCWNGNECISENESAYQGHKNYARFELPQNENECNDDSNCFVGGCNGETCTAYESKITTCDVPEGMQGGLSCKCINRVCIWTKNDK